jgi:hypothetical protein
MIVSGSDRLATVVAVAAVVTAAPVVAVVDRDPLGISFMVVETTLRT